jgi:3'(2'), 5'-bisphosphate nucleotidase
VLSEESASLSFEERSSWNSYWLVDPLDGTREFIKRNGEFTVNIALIEDGVAVLSVVYVPVTGVTYLACKGQGAFKQEASERRAISVRKLGSSLKLCLVAEGVADIYPRLGPTSEWDTAAAQCVVEQAGGFVTGTDMQPLRYNTKDSLLNPFFLVFGDDSRDWSEYL